MQQFAEQMTAEKIVTAAARPLNLCYGLVQAGPAITAVHADRKWRPCCAECPAAARLLISRGVACKQIELAAGQSGRYFATLLANLRSARTSLTSTDCGGGSAIDAAAHGADDVRRGARRSAHSWISRRPSIWVGAAALPVPARFAVTVEPRLSAVKVTGQLLYA